MVGILHVLRMMGRDIEDDVTSNFVPFSSIFCHFYLKKLCIFLTPQMGTLTTIG
jgi:hypothetical protein